MRFCPVQFGKPIYLFARWRERIEVRVDEISFHASRPQSLGLEIFKKSIARFVGNGQRTDYAA